MKDKEYWGKFVRDMPAAEFQELFWAVMEWYARLSNLYENFKSRGMDLADVHQRENNSSKSE